MQKKTQEKQQLTYLISIIILEKFNRNNQSNPKQVCGK